MRIGIDARELCGRATGAGRYLHGLLRHWNTDETTRRHEFVLYAPEPLAVSFDARRFPTRVVEGVPNTWWEQVRLPPVAARDHLDVFFAPAYTAPLATRIPLVTAIHDVSFAAHPEWFSAREGLRRRTVTRQAAARSRAVVTISEFSRREIVEHLGVPSSRVHVIPPGIEAPGPPATGAARRPQVLYVGSIFNRRRVPDLIRAFEAVARSHPDAGLDIVGDDRTCPPENPEDAIARCGLNGRATWRKFVSDDDLGRLYWSARAFAFLSEYEGLGLTPLEALAAGVPPVLLDTAVARESCGDAAVYTARGDVAGVAAALEQLLFDESVRKRLLDAAPVVLSKYAWPRAARETLALLERSASAT
jgi:glycosyltransferase involved in cell wall biosynthesis